MSLRFLHPVTKHVRRPVNDQLPVANFKFNFSMQQFCLILALSWPGMDQTGIKQNFNVVNFYEPFRVPLKIDRPV